MNKMMLCDSLAVTEVLQLLQLADLSTCEATSELEKPCVQSIPPFIFFFRANGRSAAMEEELGGREGRGQKWANEGATAAAAQR